ncbi:MAG: type II toxin-antitoxin system death-on-curing family toxin [Leptothrix sp. (in: b-proteobacteria)]
MSASNQNWVWIDAQVLRAVHEEQLSEHGGAAGVRDLGLFESALARPQQLAGDGNPPPDVADLAAAYGDGLARNHPFVDGNKRTAFVAVELFLWLNGQQLGADDADCVMTMLALAAGELAEADFAAWLRRQIQAHER